MSAPYTFRRMLDGMLAAPDEEGLSEGDALDRLDECAPYGSGHTGQVFDAEGSVIAEITAP